MKDFFIDQRLVDLVNKLNDMKVTVKEFVWAMNIALSSREVKIETRKDLDDFLTQIEQYQEE